MRKSSSESSLCGVFKLRKKFFTTKSQWEIIVIASELIEAQEMELIKSWLVLVLQLIGWEYGARFQEQSKDKV